MKTGNWKLKIICILLSPALVFAADEASTGFISRDAVISTGGTYATSSSFQLILTEGQTVTGTSSSASYSANSGFLFYPYSTLPVLSGTAGDGQVVLSWTAPNTYLGYNISTYDVGKATASGGPYTYTNVGNVLTSTRTGLTNSTAYYFVVRALDSYGDPFATSTEVSKTPVAATATTVTTSSGGGGGGGGGILSSSAQQSSGVTVSGRAFAFGSIRILDNAILVATTTADASGNFSVTYTAGQSGLHNLSISGVDGSGVSSGSQFYQITVTSGLSGGLSNLWLPPTLTTDKSEVKIGNSVKISGYGIPGHEVQLDFIPKISPALATSTDTSGKYSVLLGTGTISPGEYFVRARMASSTSSSGWTDNLRFVVGMKNTERIVEKQPTGSKMGDLSGDGKVDIKDFSILAYWFKRTPTAAFAEQEKRILGGNGTVTLRDFSILAYHWSP